MGDIASIDVDLWSADVLAAPYDIYADLRARGPVLYDPQHDVYVITRYDEIRMVLQDWERFSSANGVGVGARANRSAGNGILTSDPPRHEALRGVMNAKLVPRALAEHDSLIVDSAARHVHTAVGRGTFDAVSDLAQPYSIDVVATLTGLPDEGREHYMRWADAGFNMVGPDNERASESIGGFREMFEYCFQYVTVDRLANGGWGKAFHDAGVSGDIEPQACPGLVMAIVWAGMDTTANAIASAVQLFAKHPEQWDLLRANRAMLAGAVAEVLRIEPPVQRFTRQTTTAVDVAGHLIPEGARVVVLFGSANRDERRFANPDQFDIRRNPTDHLAFGRGVHRCVGAGLAQQELRAMLDQLADRVESFELEEERWRCNNGLHGLERLVVTVQ